MRLKALCGTLLLCAAGMWAQEGHPLNGTWHGEWKGSGSARGNVVLVLHWDAKNITGVVNPGPNRMNVKAATLDPATWTLHLEAEGKDKSGAAQNVVIDGKLDNLGSYNRTLTGTWTQNGVKGEMKASRD